MNTENALEEVEKTLEKLKEENTTIPIVVEGKKDVAALRTLGLTGEIIPLNQGLPLADFCDMLARKYNQIIIFTDWDRKGGHLCRVITKNLQSQVHCDTSFREVIARHAMTRKVEGLPSWIETIKHKKGLP